MKARLKFGVLLLLAVTGPGFGVAVAADQNQLERPDLDNYLRWGPFRVRPGIELSNLGYDDNILRRNNERIGDYTATLSPRVEGLFLLGKSAFLTVRDQLDRTVYLDNSDQNYTNNRARARLTVPLRRFGVFADLRLNQIQERPVDREDIRPERDESLLETGIVLQPGWRSEYTLSWSAADIRYTDPDQSGVGFSIGDRLDRAEDTTRLKVAYLAWGRSRLLLETLRRSIQFDRPFNSGGIDIGRDTNEWQVLAGLELDRGGPLGGSLLIGQGHIDADDPSLPDFSEWIGEMDLAYRLNSRVRLILEGERLPGFAVFEGNSYYLNSSYGGRVVYWINRFFGVESGTTFGRLTFPESGGSAREDRIHSYDVGVRLRIFENSTGRRMVYKLGIGQYNRSSTEPFAEQDRNTFSFGATLGF